MKQEEIKNLIRGQREFFEKGRTLPLANRIRALERLKRIIKEREGDIHKALKEDLGKSPTEGYMTEIGLVLSEIDHMIRHIPAYAKEKRVRTPLAQYVSKSFVKPSPYGIVLIMSPWNYPFLLTMDPLVDALSAGNTAIIKPSAYSPATSSLLEELISLCFPREYAAVVTGGRNENQSLLQEDFDYIFFTGSQAVGKEVMRKAAEHLTPMTLELGGKSPCIVEPSAKLSLAARRIVFGKFLNCGQTCVAPDYILCHESVKARLVEALKMEIRCQYGEKPMENPLYGKIINQKQFERLTRLLESDKIIWGGQTDPRRLKIEPTLMDSVQWEDPVMQEEIFGPILPILTFESLEEAVRIVNCHPHPLALYLFSENKQNIKLVLESCSFGGGCINDTIIHLATSAMGFGGVGASGMGSYHGKAGFETFSHKKSIVDKKTWMDLPMRYQPYRPMGEKLVRFFLK